MTPRARRRPTVALAARLRPAPLTGPTAPPADQAAWPSLLAIADRHRLLPALAASGLASGWLPDLPPPVREAVRARAGAAGPPPEVRLLDALYANRARIAALVAQGRDVLAALDEAGVPAVPLKGLDALLRGRYPDPGARTMTDLDVLVPTEAAGDAHAALVGAGFEPVDAPAADHHLAPLARPGAPGSVELHTKVLRGRWSTGLPCHELLADSVAPTDGGPGRRLQASDAAAVLVAHAQLQDEARVLLQLPLRALHETALVLTRERDLDWSAVADRVAAIGPGAGAALEEHLWLVGELFGPPSPVPVHPVARRHGRLVLAVADRPRIRAVVGQAAFLPRSFSADRMAALHGGSRSGLGLWATRARHAAAGVTRRLARR